MNFSEFTLAGNIFLGVGANVAPPNTGVKVSAMYGRLAKARLEGGLNDLEYAIASYERWGYGAKVTLGKNGQEVDLILFRGRDDPGSLPDSAAAQLGIAPAENFVWVAPGVLSDLEIVDVLGRSQSFQWEQRGARGGRLTVPATAGVLIFRVYHSQGVSVQKLVVR